MKYLLRGIVAVPAVLAAAILAGGAYLWLAAYRALPVTEGTVTLAGPAAAVTIARDAHGIPLITAASEEDAYFALGYAHAQERLFQMELMRRQGQGRLAEIIGKLGLASDRQMRTLGVYRRAEADFTALDPAAQAALARYAAGVNAWLAEGHPLPLEFVLLAFTPEPWRPADSLVWQKLMGLQLSGNWSEELFQAALVAKLGPARAAALTPGPLPGRPTTIAAAGLFRDLAPALLRDAMTAVIRPTMASNIWVLGGGQTSSGKPLLANDPHLPFQLPAIWYLARIETPTLKIFGATVPGVPFHMLGHNDRLAWGFTTPQSDTADLFIEQVSADGTGYLTPDGERPFDTRTERIKVRFADDAAIAVRETRHGPVVSDILRTDDAPEDIVGNGHVLALASALFQPGDRSAEAIYRFNHARGVDALLEAAKLFHAPHQNIMFADTAGAFGYYAPGLVPIRKAGDGLVPVPGWNGDYDWTGWIPFDDLPHALNPPNGVLINANNKIVGDDYPYLIAGQWPDSYRAARIAELLPAADPATVESAEAVQLDVVSGMARDMLPLLLADLTPASDRDRMLRDKLMAWDGTMDRDRFEPLLFTVWMETTKAALLADELGDLYRQFGGFRPELLVRILTDDPAWCDDARTPAVESCADAVTQGWKDAMAWYQSRNVADIEAAKWGDFHAAAFGHMLFRALPFPAWGSRSIATSGDNFTVNRGSFRPSDSPAPFRHFHGPSLRAVYDLSDLGRSRFTLPGGESGHILSPHYSDLLNDWRDGVYFTSPTAETAAERLVLTPAAP